MAIPLRLLHDRCTVHKPTRETNQLDEEVVTGYTSTTNVHCRLREPTEIETAGQLAPHATTTSYTFVFRIGTDIAPSYSIDSVVLKDGTALEKSFLVEATRTIRVGGKLSHIRADCRHITANQ